MVKPEALGEEYFGGGTIVLCAGAILRELNRCAELDGGDGCAFGIYEGRRRVELGHISCAPHRVDGGKGRVHTDGIHDPLLLPYT